ncbi:hypothetical protein DWB77_00141 [Streptomyces hundungensis]|uniref:Uncharacterized protein n=1 Tax=Streptomyces hundungensis TaxID=1077946 RepID=A0A387H3Y4_9ACTN|nr:hypothetical protein DWB77_00141 [Streptomyces hundungensis]
MTQPVTRSCGRPDGGSAGVCVGPLAWCQPPQSVPADGPRPPQRPVVRHRRTASQDPAPARPGLVRPDGRGLTWRASERVPLGSPIGPVREVAVRVKPEAAVTVVVVTLATVVLLALVGDESLAPSTSHGSRLIALPRQTGASAWQSIALPSAPPGSKTCSVIRGPRQAGPARPLWYLDRAGPWWGSPRAANGHLGVEVRVRHGPSGPGPRRLCGGTRRHGAFLNSGTWCRTTPWTAGRARGAACAACDVPCPASQT